MKKILICTQNHYTSKYQVGSHNYARAFEKLGYEVAFVSNPISPIHFLFAQSDILRTRYDIHKREGVKVGNIWYYVPMSLLTPQNKFILNSKFVFNNWHKFSVRNTLSILKIKGFLNVDILWIESPYYHFMLDKIEYKKSIFRIADFSKGFSSTWQLYYDKEIVIANQVNSIIYTAKSIKNQYKIEDKSKMIYLPNGIDLDIVNASNKDIPLEFEHIPSPRVLYIGMIDYWFDIDLICQCAEVYSQYSFIIIGDSHIDLSKLKKYSNIYILGSKPHTEISKYLFHSNVGIIPFIKDDFVDSINPIKLYEYAAYSLKVVSTKWKELEGLENLFNICEDREEFIQSLEETEITNKQALKKWIEKQDWKSKALKVINET